MQELDFTLGCSTTVLRTSAGSGHMVRLLAIAFGLTISGVAPFAIRAEQPSVGPDHAKRAAIGLKLFEQQVRTIFVGRCVACHGKDSIEGGLDLSTRDGLMKGGDSGKAIVVGQSRKSLLFKLINHDQQPRMPYEEEKLKPAEIDAIAKWIDHEAPYDSPLVAGKVRPEARPWTEKTIAPAAKGHWAFRPLARLDVPRVEDAAWNELPIDAFVRSKMDAAGVTPNSSVDRRTALRRASYALLGLPPTTEDLDEFLADESPDAHSRMIDRLLASPHYGERWARHWLDLARFAESHGFEHDYDRPTAYHYRDFVIQALNDDLPYDEFVRWQIAGDELAPNKNLALMATGFLAAGVHSTQITANEVEKHRYDELDDMLATTGTAMLGLTIGCARCHDHKFDPIPQADYYRMLSHFTTTVRTEVELDFDPETYRKAKSAFDAEHQPYVAARERYEREQLPAQLAEWERTRTSDPPAKWLQLDLAEFKSHGGATLTKQDDGSILATGANPAYDVYTFVAVTDRTKISGVRLEAMNHSSLVKGGPGRAGNGNFDLTDFRMTASPLKGEGKPIDVRLQNPLATFEQMGLPIKAALDDNRNSGWAVDPQFGKDHAASFETAESVGFEGGTRLTFTMKFDGNTGHNFGKVRLSITTAPRPITLEGGTLPAEIVAALDRPANARTEADRKTLLNWYKHQNAGWLALHQKEQQHLENAPKPSLSKVLISSEGLPAVRLHTQGGDFFQETFFLRRGDVNQKQGAAPTGFLQVATQTTASANRWKQVPPKESRLSYRRTNLANWLTDPEQGAGHLLARVIVNRMWQHHFGRGIVTTPSDFGLRGEPPTHPELLEFLAAELIRRNWRLKPIHRLILESQTWRQSSRTEPNRVKIDPDNRLFWKQTTKRLEGEVIRDATLAVSGRLDERMYGPGVLNEAMTRRSIYFTVKRSQMVPMMQVFDQPEPLSGVGERPSTTIAPQALFLLNGPQQREAARLLAARIARESTTPEEQATRLFRTALSRSPNPDELADAVAFLRTNQQPQALTDLCQVILCLNEFIYID